MKTHLFYETLERGTYLKNLFRQDKRLFLEALKKNLGFDNIYLTRAGRTGIFLSLKAFGLKREDEVFVPRYMTTCVLDSINKVAFPSLRFTEHTKAVLFYHHWGYQQNYSKAQEYLKSKKIWIIEDCAHGPWGKSQGKVIGDFGHTSVFSFPKVFAVTYVGALRVNDQSILPSIQKDLSQKKSLMDIWESICGEWEFVSFHSTPIHRRAELDVQAGLLKWYGTLSSYPGLSTVRGELPRSHEEMRAVFNKQNQHFLYLLKNARHSQFMHPTDEEAYMAPLCFPVISEDEELLNQISLWLKARNIFIGIYHFDINRCMFETNYKKCVPIPLYASLPNELYTEFVRDFGGKF